MGESIMNESVFKTHPIIPNINISCLFDLVSLKNRKDIAIDSLDLEASYQNLVDDSVVMAKAFRELGIKKNDIVCISMPNVYQAVAAFFALNRIGACTTFLNSFSSEDEIIHYLNEFESPIFINYDKNYDYNNIIKKNTKVKQIITLNKENVNNRDFNYNKNIGYNDFVDFNDLGAIANYYNGFSNNIHRGNNDALILFTSGTTGTPKAVVLTNKNIVASCIYLKNSSNTKTKKGESTLVCVPFTYPYGFATSTLTSLMCGRKAILGPNLSKDNISYYLSKKPNIIFGSPALLELIKKNTLPGQDLSSIHTFISGGDFLTPQKNYEGREFFEKHNANVKICNGSGNAETVGANTNAVGVPENLDTVGKVLVGSSAIIMNTDYTEELKFCNEGLLCISGEHVFKKYYNNPKETERSKFIYKGKTYFKTGTRGILYEDGYFKLTGRDSRYYIISTLNKVYCDRVQMLMSYIDEIEDVAFVPKPDDEMLFVGIAYVVLKKGLVPTEEMKAKILEKCQKTLVSPNGDEAQLKANEIPVQIVFVPELPRTKADKINYNLLEEDAKKLVLTRY